MNLLEKDLSTVSVPKAHTLTPEQQLIVDCDVAPGELIKVIAYAGTGKTSTNVAYAERRPLMRGTYLAFNKSVEQEAKSKFGSNVLSKTVHAMAYSVVGRRYTDIKGSVQNWMVAKALRVPIYEATLVCRTLETFLNSAADVVELVHVEPDRLNRLRPDYATGIQSNTQAIWEAVQAGSHGFSMTHSGYLKLYQLSRPQIPGDVIMLDEAQDTNPVTQELVMSQLRYGKAVIMCGDPYQQIYAWRGAIDAMAAGDGKTFYLTQSFRFGQPVADVANRLLSHFFNETTPLRGTDHPSYVGRDFQPSDGAGSTTITRTNSEIFRQVVTLALADRPFHVYGQEAFYQLLDQVQDVFMLYAGKRERVLDRRIGRHNTFTDLTKFAEDTLDIELSSRCRIVETYRDQIPDILAKIRRLYRSMPEHGLPIFVTCHKAKGLEWPHCRLGEDFDDLYDEHGKLKTIGVREDQIAADELNLYYVAATRARQSLCLNHQLATFLARPTVQTV